jgi:hypothetical protein
LSKYKKCVKDLKKDRPSLPQRVKLFTATAELDNQTPEEASEEAGNIHYNVFKDDLNKNIV